MRGGEMRVSIDPIYLFEAALEKMTKLDQLTIVRNHARRGFEAHDKDAEDVFVEEVEVEVSWLDGDIETLVFNRLCGFPVSPKRDWYQQWRNETLAAEAS
jgi:hypothetical protein